MSACRVSGTSSVAISPVGRYIGSLLGEQAAVEQHPHRLHRVQRHALGTLQDLLAHPIRQSRHQPLEHFLHRRLGRAAPGRAR